jgi:ADP-ribose diphosphatase
MVYPPTATDERKPKILNIRTAARSKLFEIEVVRVQFSNGYEAQYERVSSGMVNGAVVVVPMLDPATVLLVREYAVGFDRYELGLPKGLIRPNESLFQAANRELTEEVGYMARQFSRLYSLSIAPGFLCYATEIVLASDLAPEKQNGDEPEALEVIPWPLQRLDALIGSGEITDARSVAALFLAREFIGNGDWSKVSK